MADSWVPLSCNWKSHDKSLVAGPGGHVTLKEFGPVMCDGFQLSSETRSSCSLPSPFSMGEKKMNIFFANLERELVTKNKICAVGLLV